MAKTVFLFSGQGSQYCGMGKELLEANPEFSYLYEKASDILGFDLADICFNADEVTLSQTIYAQPAIMVTSLLAFEVAKKNGIKFEAVAGHSLGEYAGLVASEMVSLETGFKLIKSRSAAMDKCAKNSSGTMCAVLKLTAQQIEEVCEKTDGYVAAVNYNSPAQTVIAGEQDAVAKACDALSAIGGRCMPLKVASAFHSEIMKPASEEFYNEIKDIQFNAPKVTFYSNVLGTALNDFSDMPALLAKHIISPVRFTAELAEMEAIGFDTFIELGPNKVLTGLVKKTLKSANAMNIENIATLEKVIS